MQIPVELVKDIKTFKMKPFKPVDLVWKPEQPVPRLHSVSESGLIKIVWDREMLIPIDVDEIPTTRYVLVDESLKIKV